MNPRTTIRIVSRPQDLSRALDLEYLRLAQSICRRFSRKRGVLAEIGCGTGQLTVPLARLLSGWSLRVVDNFKGSYSGSHRVLLKNLHRERVERRVQLRVSDYRSWLNTQSTDSYDVVVSSEFLPELDAAETCSFLQESHRIVGSGGVVINSFLSPVPRNIRQKLLIEADSNPKWTKDPPKEWFSPTREFVAKSLRQAGFSTVKTSRLKTGLIVRADASRSLLKSWDVRPSFWNKYRSLLEKQGLELPDWIITTGKKNL